MALPPGSFAACAPASTRWPAASRVASGTGLGWVWEHATASSAAASRMRMGASLWTRGGDPISFPFDLHDGQLYFAGRPAHAHGVALALSQERLPERRLVTDAAGTKVFRELVAPDDLVRRLLAVLVLHGDGGAEEGAADPLPRGGVDDLERLDQLLQPVELRVDLAQLPLAQLVLVVLAPVAVGGGHRHLVGHAGALLVEQDAELLAEPLEPRLGDVALSRGRTLHAPSCCLKRRNAATSRTDVDCDHPGDPRQREEPFPA